MTYRLVDCSRHVLLSALVAALLAATLASSARANTGSAQFYANSGYSAVSANYIQNVRVSGPVPVCAAIWQSYYSIWWLENCNNQLGVDPITGAYEDYALTNASTSNQWQWPAFRTRDHQPYDVVVSVYWS